MGVQPCSTHMKSYKQYSHSIIQEREGNGTGRHIWTTSEWLDTWAAWALISCWYVQWQDLNSQWPFRRDVGFLEWGCCTQKWMVSWKTPSRNGMTRGTPMTKRKPPLSRHVTDLRRIQFWAPTKSSISPKSMGEFILENHHSVCGWQLIATSSLLIHRRVTPAELHHVILPGTDTSSTGHTLKHLGWWLFLRNKMSWDVMRCHKQNWLVGSTPLRQKWVSWDDETRNVPNHQPEKFHYKLSRFKHVRLTLEKRSCPSLSTETADDCKALCRPCPAKDKPSASQLSGTIQQGNTWNIQVASTGASRKKRGSGWKWSPKLTVKSLVKKK